MLPLNTGECRYLEQQTFLQEVEGLLEDALAFIGPARESRAADKELRRQGLKCSHKVYQAAYDHLQARQPLCSYRLYSPSSHALLGIQVAKCAQRLQLPGATNGTHSPDAMSGSASHVFGVKPKQLIALQVPDLAAAQVKLSKLKHMRAGD